MRRNVWRKGLLGALTAFVLAANSSPNQRAYLTEDAGDTLRPGQSLWAPEATLDGPVTVVVSVGSQRAYVYKAGMLLGVSTVSTGKRGHSTPLGDFVILEKRRHHRSNIYSNAPMPFMQRLTWTGIALHEGQLPGYPASHGCIRMPREFAQRLFGTTDVGTVVLVTDYDSRLPPETRSDPTPRLQYDYVMVDSGGGTPIGAMR